MPDSASNHTHARFWTCALQVNPHTYSKDYRGTHHGPDAKTYAEAIRERCLDKKIEVVGLADHGSVANTGCLRQVLADAGIVVFPGFEVATSEKVHWFVCSPKRLMRKHWTATWDV